MKKTLIYGYGNPGRQDDALGILCANAIEKWAKNEGLDWLAIETNYQLNIEDASTISEYEEVFFVDASQEEIDGVTLTEVVPNDAKIEFSMHALSPMYVLHLCHQIFGVRPKTKLVHIKGFSWGFDEGLSREANKNLQKAILLLKEQLFVGV